MMPPKNLDELVKAVQVWITSEHIYNAQKDQQSILKFLQGCKYDLDKTITKMRNFYAMRRNTPELFHGRDPSQANMETLLNMGASFPLPEKTPEGATIIVIKAAVNNPRVIPMTDVFKLGIMTIDLIMELDDDLTKNGTRVIVDMTGVGIYHAVQMTPRLIYNMVHLWQNCYPIKIRSIDFVNCPTGIDLVLNIFRQFLTEKLKKRLRTHGTTHFYADLHEIIPSELLPEEYGGCLGPEEAIFKEWKIKMQNFREWFLTDDTVS